MTQKQALPRVDVAYALLVDEAKEKMLVVYNADSDHWSMPGGAVEPGETLEEGVIREAREEVGVGIGIEGIIAVNEGQYHQQQVVFFTFRAHILDGEPAVQNPEEVSKVLWMDFEEADNLLPWYPMPFRELVNRNAVAPYTDEMKLK